MRMGGAKSASERLHVTGVYPRDAISGPGVLDVFVNKVPTGRVALPADDDLFTAALDLPQSAVGVPAIDIELMFDKPLVVRSNQEQRELGGAFVRFEIK